MNHFIGIQKEHLNVVQNGKVLKADKYLTYKTAAEIIQEAKTDAELIVAEAEDAYRLNKAEGYQLGIEEGRAEFAANILEATKQANNYIRRKESQIVDVVVTAVRSILGEFEDAELTLRIVKKAINELQGQQQITIRVVPDQTEIIEHALQEITHSSLLIKVVSDIEIQSGQCILESDLGLIECSIDDQVDAIRNAMTLNLIKENVS
ncbi:MAG: HrpE/YscL family type III secretion apparatus protein [Methylococcaceae bacterium]